MTNLAQSACGAKPHAKPPEISPVRAYQESLPYVPARVAARTACPNPAGQWDLFDGGADTIAELAADPRFAELDPDQLPLFDAPGCPSGAHFVRKRNGHSPERVPWTQLEMWRLFRDRFRGKKWSALDLERREAIFRQTWGASEAGGCRDRLPWLHCDGIVDPWGDDVVLGEFNRNTSVQLAGVCKCNGALFIVELFSR